MRVEHFNEPDLKMVWVLFVNDIRCHDTILAITLAISRVECCYVVVDSISCLRDNEDRL